MTLTDIATTKNTSSSSDEIDNIDSITYKDLIPPAVKVHGVYLSQKGEYVDRLIAVEVEGELYIKVIQLPKEKGYL